MQRSRAPPPARRTLYDVYIEGEKVIGEQKQPKWLRVSYAARALNVSESTIRRCLVSEELEGIKVRGAVRVDRDSLIRLIRSRRYADLVRWADPSPVNFQHLRDQLRRGAL
jgi:excisionase family DNA binding protein